MTIRTSSTLNYKVTQRLCQLIKQKTEPVPIFEIKEHVFIVDSIIQYENFFLN